MAIYHCSVKVIGRSAGRSAIACAAYRSGEKLYSEETDRTFDYSNKGGVVHSEIALCANAPERFLDRQTLWNSVQSVENKSDSRLAREFELALPLECSKEEWIEIGRAYAAFMTEQGMIADWSIHDPVNKETGIRQNPHIHMMCTTRPITESGEWGAKEKKGYKLDEHGERIPVIDPKTGEQKIGARGRKMWQREMIDATGWDSRAKVFEWREKWSEVVNAHLEPEQHIDHRSYAEQGIDLIPTVHEGYAAQKIDKEQMKETGTHAELVQNNIDIREQNRIIQLMNQIRQEILKKARAIYERIKELAGIREVIGSVGTEFALAPAGEQGIERRKREIEQRELEAPSVFERARARITAHKAEETRDKSEGMGVKNNAGSEQLAQLIKRRAAAADDRIESVDNGSGREKETDGKALLDELRVKAAAAERAREEREAEQQRLAAERSREKEKNRYKYRGPSL